LTKKLTNKKISDKRKNMVPEGHAMISRK